MTLTPQKSAMSHSEIILPLLVSIFFEELTARGSINTLQITSDCIWIYTEKRELISSIIIKAKQNHDNHRNEIIKELKLDSYIRKGNCLQ